MSSSNFFRIYDQFQKNLHRVSHYLFTTTIFNYTNFMATHYTEIYSFNLVFLNSSYTLPFNWVLI